MLEYDIWHMTVDVRPDPSTMQQIIFLALATLLFAHSLDLYEQQMLLLTCLFSISSWNNYLLSFAGGLMTFKLQKAR